MTLYSIISLFALMTLGLIAIYVVCLALYHCGRILARVLGLQWSKKTIDMVNVACLVSILLVVFGFTPAILMVIVYGMTEYQVEKYYKKNSATHDTSTEV